MVVDDIARIAEKLAELRARDVDYRVFGADSHGYRLNPTLTDEQVRRFEQLYDLALPPDYRAFLLQLGDGGAGPYYGVFRLGLFGEDSDAQPWPPYFRLREPFPHTVAWNDLSIVEEGAPKMDDFESAEAYDAAYDDWRETEGESRDLAYWEATGTGRGSIPICHHGCNLRDWLVVAGPEAGHVWHDASADFLGIAPISKPGRPRTTFTQWYLDWLDDSLAELRGAPS